MILIEMFNSLEFSDILKGLEHIYMNKGEKLTSPKIKDYNTHFNRLINEYKKEETNETLLIQYKRLYSDIDDKCKMFYDIILFNNKGNPEDTTTLYNLIQEEINRVLSMKVIDSK